MNQYRVQKFGGSSLASADCFRQVAEITLTENHITVVSAVGGVTNQLQSLLDLASRQQSYQTELGAVIEMQWQVIHGLALPVQDFKNSLTKDHRELSEVLQTVHLTKSYSTHISDLVLSYGEQWSAQMLTAFLQQKADAQYVDASAVIFIKHRFGMIEVDWQKSQTAFDALLAESSAQQIVITGFLACDDTGKRTTLGRNGSDFSAAIIATLYKAQSLTIWTDVDGVYSADPRRVSKAFVLPQLSYQEVLELSYFGAKVLHPQAIAPAIDNNIDIVIKNTFNPQAVGTTITVSSAEHEYLVSGVSSIDDVALINVQGPGLVGVAGIAARLFKCLSDAEVSVILISQASSEHSICIAVRVDDAVLAVDAVEHQFKMEMQAGLMEAPVVDRDCAVIAAVGEGMVGTPGITAKLGQALAQANISIKALAQGSSERNISAVIDKADINKALRVVHSGFYLSNKTLSLGVIGPGLIGSTLLNQLAKVQQELLDKHHVKLLVRGIINSQKMLLADHDIALDRWQEQFADAQTVADVPAFMQHVSTDDIPHSVIIDCSANQTVANYYADFLRGGLHIITPNKKACSGPIDYYYELMDLLGSGNQHFLYETTVCAGLPVIKTLQDMMQSGDEVKRIEGIVSGTLAYIFNELKTGQCFSSIVLQAKEKGFTEPDPRDDLSGLDVARKMVVLAREAGLELGLDDVQVLNLVPEALRDVSLETFLQRLPEFDEQIMQQLDTFLSQQKTPCYVGKINQDGSVQVEIAGYDAQHPFSHLKGTDNILAFYTERYNEQPLVVQGPGAGAQVTAAGVFADLLRLVSFLD